MSGRILDSELKEFDATSLSGSYQNFGAALSNPALKIQFINTSDVDAYISFDGSNNKFRIPAGTQATFDEMTAGVPNKGQEYYASVGTQMQVKQVTGAGGSGTIIGHIITRVL